MSVPPIASSEPARRQPGWVVLLALVIVIGSLGATIWFSLG